MPTQPASPHWELKICRARPQLVFTFDNRFSSSGLCCVVWSVLYKKSPPPSNLHVCYQPGGTRQGSRFLRSLVDTPTVCKIHDQLTIPDRPYPYIQDFSELFIHLIPYTRESNYALGRIKVYFCTMFYAAIQTVAQPCEVCRSHVGCGVYSHVVSTPAWFESRAQDSFLRKKDEANVEVFGHIKGTVAWDGFLA